MVIQNKKKKKKKYLLYINIYKTSSSLTYPAVNLKSERSRQHEAYRRECQQVFLGSRWVPCACRSVSEKPTFLQRLQSRYTPCVVCGLSWQAARSRGGSGVGRVGMQPWAPSCTTTHHQHCCAHGLAGLSGAAGKSLLRQTKGPGATTARGSVRKLGLCR